MSHSGCSSANFSHMVCSHSPLSFDWSSDGDQTIRRTCSLFRRRIRCRCPDIRRAWMQPAPLVSRTANPLFFIVTALSFQKSFVLFRYVILLYLADRLISQPCITRFSSCVSLFFTFLYSHIFVSVCTTLFSPSSHKTRITKLCDILSFVNRNCIFALLPI